MKTLDNNAPKGGLELPRVKEAVGENRTVVTAQPFFGFEWRSPKEPNYLVYVFSVTERTFKDVGQIHLTIPGMSVPLPDGGDAKAWLKDDNDKRQPFRLITSFPQPILFQKANFDTNELDFVEQDVRKFVVDLISPDMSGSISLNEAVDVNQAFSQGNDLSRSGLFFDYQEVPSKAELDKAYARLEKYYKALLEQARTLGLTDKPQFESKLRENPDYVFAADWSGDEFEWHKKSVRAVVCDHCGERKTTKKPFHRTTDGYLCVEPSQDAWKQAYNVGLVQKDRIPETFIWWKTEAAK